MKRIYLNINTGTIYECVLGIGESSYTFDSIASYSLDNKTVKQLNRNEIMGFESDLSSAKISKDFMIIRDNELPLLQAVQFMIRAAIRKHETSQHGESLRQQLSSIVRQVIS
jgi:hypothetical protein